MTLVDRIDAFVNLGEEILQKPEWLEQAVNQAYLQNKWFTKDQSWNALEAIAIYFLQKENLNSWAAKYNISEDSPKRIGLVLAGNIPLVGFHDVLCCIISGNTAVIKLSSKDTVLLKSIYHWLEEHTPELSVYFEIAERLKNFDAIIATGSDNTSKHFEQYFGKYPNIIRKNRNAVAVLSGKETKEEFEKLGHDIFNYYGLGCRNVSKIFVPSGYKFDDMLGALHESYKHLANHDKYRNNFDYNNALFMLNKVPFLMSGSLIVMEDEAIASRIATVHYAYYNDLTEVAEELKSKEHQIQCVVSNIPLDGVKTFALGDAQNPSISDYADGVDTMEFLTNLK